MAYNSQLFIILATLALVSPCMLATEFIVGDDKGWTINFDYQAWAQGKQFYVGDKLVFNYPKGAHNVFKVNGTGFQQCAAPLDSVPLTSGNDVISLATPGRKWYICGVAKHCAVGNQKLLITVLPSSLAPSPSLTASSPSTSIPYTSAASESLGTKYWWMMAVVGILGMLMA
ncbi:PREDICTED: mavicyanin-like [Prunus mume]|uniref:Mavicyanin-like n=1 Tax=Prunus mume TaxID=102107 RepID=A0ABM0PF29_PRUMU|nr:PREDICTED: mavicyanin-like [Prunus mume]